jgi:hypothetical protein
MNLLNKSAYRSLFTFSGIILFFGIYLTSGIIALDPDFGWHIRMGQIILAKGIPVADPFSYTMANYPIVDHEWLTNVFIASVYPHIGKLGLAIFFAGLAVSALFLSCLFLPKAIRRWITLPLFLAGATLVSFAGVRTQVITWFFLAILLNLLFNDYFAKKKVYLIPLLFVFWVNLHGAFASGIVLLGMLTVIGMIVDGVTIKERNRRTKLSKTLAIFIKQRLPSSLKTFGIQISLSRMLKYNFRALITFFASILATFLNPYGLRIWWEVWMQFSDQNLRGTIAEWTPAFNFPNFLFWAFFALSLLLTLRYLRKYSLREWGIYLFLLIAGISSKRHIPLWVIVALPMTGRALYWLSQEAGTIKYGKERFTKAYKGFFILSGLLFVFNMYIAYFSMQSGNESVFYPVEAARYVQTHRPVGNIWSPYDWNGYLVWKVPGLRVFIDGMMPSWRAHAWIGESPYAFDEYIKLLQGKVPLKEVMKRYSIDMILVPSEAMDTAFFKDRQTTYTILKKQISQMHLKAIYRDKKVVIYSK